MGGISLFILTDGFNVDAGSSLIYVPFRINLAASRIILQYGTKKKSAEPACPAEATEDKAGATTWRSGRAEAPRPPARLSARGGLGARARRILERGFCGNLARRSLGGDRHEPAEPLWRL